MATVLLVDDQIEMRSIHGAYLQLHGFKVLTAGDGDRALETARKHVPDVIVLDHSLPSRTGIEIARELRAQARTAKIPIIMMTAHTYGAVGKKAREAGCSSFLAKPCPPSRVLHEVQRFVKEPSAS